MSSLFRNFPLTLTRARRTVAACAALTLTATIAASAGAQSWSGNLVGTNEVPPNASTATGFVSMSLSGNFLSLSLTWNGLTGGNVSAGHIHCCTAPGSNVGVAVGFNGLSASTSGTYSNLFDLTNSSIYTSGFINNFGGGTTAGAQAALIAGLNAGTAYVNLHNAQFPGGEIRANVVTVTPEPASMVLMGFGLASVAVAVRRRKRAG